MIKRCLVLLLAAVLMLLITGCSESEVPQTPGPSLTVTDEEALKVYFLDVGKGDSALIGIPGGYWAMIDAGTKEGYRETGRQMIKNGVDKLSAVFLTHGHSDHIGGLPGVLSIADCKMLYTNGDAMSEKKIKEAASSGIPVMQMEAGNKVQIGEATITVISPVRRYDDENDNSLVLMLKYKNTKLLFAADQRLSSEHDLVDSGADLDADVLKVAHHGEDDSSSAGFIGAVSPLYAVITADKENPPAEQVLNSLSAAGALPFVLGETGTMLLESDGETVKMSSLPAPDKESPDVRIEAYDFSAEYVTVANRSGELIDLTGWCIFSDKGNETYFFPKGTALKPGESVSVLSGGAAASPGDGLVWTTEKVWSKKDTCSLFDGWGREVARV